MNKELINIYNQINNYQPYNQQEEKDKQFMLDFIKNNDNCLLRENNIAHFTVSAWIVNLDNTKVLMAYHNIYQSYAWLGGHADGNNNFIEVCCKEIKEESSLTDFKLLDNNIFSLEVLCVDGHIKRNEYVSSHLHLNVTYLFQADSNSTIKIKEDENSAIAWVNIEDINNVSNEKWFKENIYSKLVNKYNENIFINNEN